MKIKKHSDNPTRVCAIITENGRGLYLPSKGGKVFRLEDGILHEIDGAVFDRCAKIMGREPVFSGDSITITF